MPRRVIRENDELKVDLYPELRAAAKAAEDAAINEAKKAEASKVELVPCAVCKKPTPKSKKCARCKKVIYCGEY